MSETNDVENETWFVNSLARGLSVLLAFSNQRKALSTSDVARACGLSRAAARRFLLTLTELGYLRSVDNRFVISARALDLGHAYLSSSGAVDLLQPSLETLTDQCGETSSLAILDGSEVVYVARTPTRRMISLRVGIGSRIPVYASSLGKAILAFMDEDELSRLLKRIELRPLTDQTVTDKRRFRQQLKEARINGYAVTVSELEYGVASIAVPIMEAGGRVVAAVNISTHVSIHDRDVLAERFLQPLRTAKTQIETALQALPNVSLRFNR